jgi:hypothetical protein
MFAGCLRMANLPIDKIKAAEKIRDEIEKLRAKKKAGSAVAVTASKYGINRTTAQNYLKLLELSSGAQFHVSTGDLAMRNALAILKAPKSRQDEFSDLAVNASLNREDILKRILLTAQPLEERMKSKVSRGKESPDINRLIDAISENLTTPIHIERGEGESGVVQVKIFLTHILTAILNNSDLLESTKCKMEAKLDLSKTEIQPGEIKFFYQNTLQKHAIIKLLSQAAKEIQR